ncbi:MAG: hypothetical protein JNK58_08515 [Phycisphaerae bacterium]|nr:hypothetical protein [Phycisphaerae bacterium]
MSDSLNETLVTIAIAGITLTCILHALSTALMHEVRLIDLKRETARLHREHMKRMAELRAGRIEGDPDQVVTSEFITDETARAA